MKIVNVMNFARAVEPRLANANWLISAFAGKGVCNEAAGLGLPEEEMVAARIEEGKKCLFDTTRRQMELAIRTKTPTTFLLQYDALCDERYLTLMRSAPDYIEVGLWYEIVKDREVKDDTDGGEAKGNAHTDGKCNEHGLVGHTAVGDVGHLLFENVHRGLGQNHNETENEGGNAKEQGTLR